MNAVNDTGNTLPADLRGTVEAQLAAGEKPLVWLELDLDSRLHYASGLLVLTDRRLIDIGPTEGGAAARRGDWPMRPFGLAAGGDQGLAGERTCGRRCPRVAGGRKPARPVALHDRPRTASASAGRSVRPASPGERAGGEELAEPATVCPSCGAILAADQRTCPDCGRSKDKPAVEFALPVDRLRQARAVDDSVGFVLMVASTSAGLVPPYLTRPLMDNVLIPAIRTAGQRDLHLVWWFLLAGFAGAAVLAWLLSWARTYVLAWVSERIAADLRNRTYAHLQSLSLEYFGGKRTGDLISRVSTDTDRICYFLSVNLLDFASDVLMIVHDRRRPAVASTPLLAVATLLPLPLIAYLVHRVRNRLRRVSRWAAAPGPR